MPRRHCPLLLCAVLFGLVVTFVGAFAQGPTKRLVLKDGSYQIVTKWAIQGDRVHYYSAERAEWEDVPNSMVDWDATKQDEPDRATGNLAPDAMQLEEESKPASKELPWDRFRIVRSQVKGDKRIVGDIKIAVYGKASQEQNIVPADAEQLPQGWIKLTPKSALQPGEYAVAELLGKQGMNSYVWDFGVHPDAPANLTVIKPEVSDQKQSSTVDTNEQLQKRK